MYVIVALFFKEKSLPTEQSSKAVTIGLPAPATSTTAPSTSEASNSHQVLQQQSSIMPNAASSLSGSSPPNPVETLPQHVHVSSPIPHGNKKPAISDVVADCIFYCKEHNINDPIEIIIHIFTIFTKLYCDRKATKWVYR